MVGQVQGGAGYLLLERLLWPGGAHHVVFKAVNTIGKIIFPGQIFCHDCSILNSPETPDLGNSISVVAPVVVPVNPLTKLSDAGEPKLHLGEGSLPCTTYSPRSTFWW